MKLNHLLLGVAVALGSVTVSNAARVEGFIYAEAEADQAIHTLWGIPATEQSDLHDLVFREAYALQNDGYTKFADWVSFRLEASMMGGPSRPRDWRTDPNLDPSRTMWAKSRSNHGMLGISRRKDNKIVKESYDLGHQANLSAFSKTAYWEQTNYFSNITPQKTWLNQGIWEELEARTKHLAHEEGPIWIFSGPLYYDALVAFEQSEDFQMHKAYVESNPDWKDNPLYSNGALNFGWPCNIPTADEEGVRYWVPAGYWKVIVVTDDPENPTLDNTWCASFIFGQETPEHKESIMPYLYNIDMVEAVAGIDLLWELPDDLEDQLEKWYFNDTVEGKRPQDSKYGLTRRY